ncbi:MAG: tryptophan 7-halogenase, partial [Chitinophagales bacterium]
MNHSKDIQNIVIVGGGTSGWMTAAYLHKALNRQEGEPTCQITLIEASDIPSVGVGEATIPIFKHFFGYLGFDEGEWMEACHATYKLAIKFVGWVDGSADDYYWHTFGSLSSGGVNQMQHWLHAQKHGYSIPFAQSVHEAVHVCEAQKAPKSAYTPVQGTQRLGYAMHLDAGLLADLLKKHCKGKGIQHLVGKVKHVNLDEKGFIN